MVTYKHDIKKRFVVGDIFAVGNSGGVLVYRKITGLKKGEKPNGFATVWIFDNDNEEKVLAKYEERPIREYANSLAVFIPKDWIGKVAKVQIIEEDKKEK